MSDHAVHHQEHHTNYILIWALLLILLIISLVGPVFGILAVTILTAFGIAIVKGLMVCAYFMHLNVEKKIIWYLMLGSLTLVTLFFFAVAPDVMAHHGDNWINTKAPHVPAHAHGHHPEAPAHH